MKDFREIAKKEITLSELMTGRTQLKTEDIIAKYPNGVTVNRFDIVVLDGKAFPIATIAEDDSVYFNGGTIMSKICEEWANSYGGEIESASNDLEKAGGVKMIFEQAKTKKGNNITRVHII